MSDPMDIPPTDHGSDRYDHVEIEWPFEMEEPDLPEWLTDDWAPCQDCRANAFLRWVDGRWQVTIAHEDTCPTLRAHEQQDHP